MVKRVEGREVVYLDTNVCIWLYKGLSEIFEPKTLGRLEDADILISGIVLLELQYLYEIKKIIHRAEKVFTVLSADFGISLCVEPLHSISIKALDENWTRDPFDRLIVANAQLKQDSLCAKEREILKQYRRAFW